MNLKKMVFLSLICLAPGLPVKADRTGLVGVGVSIGEPFGPMLKYWTASTQAVNLGVGFDDDPIFYGEYLWHNWSLIPQPASGGKIGAYMGVGPRLEVRDHRKDEFGFRIPLGLNFMLSRAPIEFYGELVPVLQISPDSDSDLDGGVGVRIYFSPADQWRLRN